MSVAGVGVLVLRPTRDGTDLSVSRADVLLLCEKDVKDRCCCGKNRGFRRGNREGWTRNSGYSSQHEGEVADLWNKTKARKFSSILCTHTYIVM
ncbi:unnamed protein product [Musa acuminata subsp. burmannicoides]